MTLWLLFAPMMVAAIFTMLWPYGDDLEGWQGWLRAYMVLGDYDKALTNDIDDTMKCLGLEG